MALTSYQRRPSVDEALRTVNDLRQALLEHVDLFHWSFPVGEPDVLALRDYTLGVVNAAGGDLEQAWISQVLYERASTARSGRYGDNLKATGHPFADGEIRARIDELSIELRTHRLSTVVSLAAALDCLAGSASAILGIGINVMKADLGMIFHRPDFHIQKDLLGKLSSDEEWRLVQQGVLREVSDQIHSAGPPGWADWLVNERNTLVHRELPTDVTVVDSRRGRTVWVSMLQQSPHFSNVQSLQTTPDEFKELVLLEDSTATLEGLVLSVADVVAHAAVSLQKVWERRRQTRPEIPWRAQWKPAGEKSEFQGYNPGSVKFGKDSVLMMSPEQGKRLREADVIK